MLIALSALRPWKGSPMPFVWIVMVVVVLALLVLSLAIRVVKQYEQGVLFRLGRVIGVRKPGLTVIQGYCVVGLLVVTASMRSFGRRLARLVARAMLVSPLLRWYPMAVLRSVANTAGPLPVRAW